MATGSGGAGSLAQMASKSSRRRKRANQRHRSGSSSSLVPTGSAVEDVTDDDASRVDAPAERGSFLSRLLGNGAGAGSAGAGSQVAVVDATDDDVEVAEEAAVEGEALQGELVERGPIQARVLDGDDESAPQRRWGLGDAIGGWAVAQVASILAVAAVVTYLGYPKVAGLGGSVGQAVGQTEVGSAIDILTVYGDLPFVWQVLLQVPLWVGLAGAPILAARRKGTSLAVDFGFRMERNDVPIGLAIGVALQLVLVPLIYVPLRLLGGDTDEVSEPARELVDNAVGPLGVVLLLLVVGLGAPVVEELFYRGLTQRALLNRIGRPAWAVVIAALFFALAHLQSLQFPALVAVGIAFGVLAQRSGRLGPSIFAHMGFNLTTAVVFLFDLQLPFT